jgi:diguanylate cyclase (GGDEF)-like protein
MREAEAIRVLLVEDSEDDALLLERRLRAALPVAALRRVDSAQSMRAALAEGPWDVVISDHVMPGFDSDAALALLRESGSDAPFILYSGCLDEGRGALAMRVGASDWIAKHDPARIVPVIERELRNARLRRDKERAERAAAELASYDTLTRLPNRSLFCEQAGLRLDAIGAEDGAAALLYVDLDRFMRINETLGYAAGDAVIRQIAVRLRAEVPAGSLVARLGQDEFAILVAVAGGAREPRRLAERLARRFAEPIVVSGQEFYVTLSVGVSLFPAHGRDCETLLKSAESAMHFVKRLGGNGHRIYQAELQAATCENLRLENELRHAIERRQLHVVYQPIYDIATHRVVAAEALLRWRHPEMGLVPPDRFIPVADDTGQIHAIGAWVLERACEDAYAWEQRFGRGIAVAVNFSATQFRHKQFLPRVLGILRASGLAPHLLEMEITEGTAMHDAEAAAEVLGALKRAGVRIAIDDFGTGYSSLSYLRRLPIDILKIDKSFMREIPHDAENIAIVRTILALGHAMRLECHAEGVETPAQLALLREERCARAQGYLLGRPLEAPAFAERLAGDGAAEFSPSLALASGAPG